MAGANPKGPSSSSSSRKPSSSHGKSRWESPKNPPSEPKPATTGSKPTKPSSKPKQSPAKLPGPSKPHSDAVAVPGSLPAHGPGPAFHLNDPAGPPPFPDPAAVLGPPPPPAYGFHMLDRRTIVLADGSVRSYFALPPDYQDFPPPPLGPFDPAERFLPPFGGPPEHGGGGGVGLGFDKGFPGVGRFSPEGYRRDHRERDYWNSVPLAGEGSQQKRKYGGGDERDERDEFARQRQQLLHYGNPSAHPNNGDYLAGRRGEEDFRASKHMRGGGDYDVHSSHGMVGGDANLKNYPHDLDPQAIKKSFLHYVKLVNENPAQKKNYLEDGKQRPLQCLACGRASREFPDMHSLIMHTYNSHDLRVDHLGLHKALCVLMGWNYAKAPDNSRAYQLLSADEAEANKEDIILWPPMVIIHNTNTGKGKDGRMEGMGNKLMDNKLKDLGFSGGKSKSLYGKEGHLGITLVKFAGDQSGFKEAMRLSDFFEKENHGRKGWARVQSSLSGRDEENNANLVKVDEKTGEKKRIFYGYLGTASDLDNLDGEARKKAGIESLREFNR